MNDGAPVRPACLWPGCTNAACTRVSGTCHACHWRLGQLIQRGALPVESPRTLAELRASVRLSLPALWAEHGAARRRRLPPASIVGEPRPDGLCRAEGCGRPVCVYGLCSSCSRTAARHAPGDLFALAGQIRRAEGHLRAALVTASRGELDSAGREQAAQAVGRVEEVIGMLKKSFTVQQISR